MRKMRRTAVVSVTVILVMITLTRPAVGEVLTEWHAEGYPCTDIVRVSLDMTEADREVLNQEEIKNRHKCSYPSCGQVPCTHLHKGMERERERDLFKRETEHLYLRPPMHGIGRRRAWDGNTLTSWYPTPDHPMPDVYWGRGGSELT